MILSVIRDLASQRSKEELEQAATKFEESRELSFPVEGKDDAEILTHMLMAAAVRSRMDAGQSLQDAVRDHARSVQKMLKVR